MKMKLMAMMAASVLHSLEEASLLLTEEDERKLMKVS